MSMMDMPLLSMLREKMAWLGQRQNLLSQNVANADTPGYAARDLKALDFEDTLRSVTGPGFTPVTLMTDDPRQIAPQSEAAQFEDTEAPDAQATSTGNTVSLEQEMIKVADTQAQYQAATNLYAKTMSMMRTAIGQP